MLYRTLGLITVWHLGRILSLQWIYSRGDVGSYGSFPASHQSYFQTGPFIGWKWFNTTPFVSLIGIIFHFNDPDVQNIILVNFRIDSPLRIYNTPLNGGINFWHVSDPRFPSSVSGTLWKMLCLWFFIHILYVWYFFFKYYFRQILLVWVVM